MTASTSCSIVRRLENVYKNCGVFINVRQDVRTTLRHQVYKSSYTNLSGLHQDTQRWTKGLSEEGQHFLKKYCDKMNAGCDK